MTPTSPDALAPLLQRGRWFAALPPDRQAQLLQPARPLHLVAGETLFLRGDPNAGLYAVLDGSVRIGAVDSAGRDVTLGLLQPPQWFGEIAFFDGGPRTHDASAREPSTLLCVPRPALLAMLQQDPGWWQHLGQLMAEKVRALFLGLEDLAALPATPRVVRRLLAMAEGHGMLAPGVAHRSVAVNQEQLGAMLSLSRQTVSEVLRELESRGLLRRQYGAIELLDPAALARLGP